MTSVEVQVESAEKQSSGMTTSTTDVEVTVETEETDTTTTASTNTSTIVPEVAAPEDDPSLRKGIKVLFLSSDTGGGHRASAQSLAGQFELLFPGSTYDLLDLATETYLPPYNSIVSHYKHLSANPSQWKMLYGVTNSRFMERAVDTNIKVMSVVCERSIRKRIKSYEPDVVVSVHPLQTSVPILSCAKISHETGKHLPMFTVVTDLGSAHATWFANGVEKMFVGSKQIYELAKERGSVPDDKLILLGLPIRHDFSVESDQMGDRMSPQGKAYQESVRAKLNLPATDRKTLLVMGGGEGVGSLSNIVDALYYELTKQGIDAVVCVVCGRNETLLNSLAERDWSQVYKDGEAKAAAKGSAAGGGKTRRSMLPTIPSMFGDLSSCGEDAITPVGCIEAGGMTKSLRKILSAGSLMNTESTISPIFVPSTGSALEGQKASNDTTTTTTTTENSSAPKENIPSQLNAAPTTLSTILSEDGMSAVETETNNGEASVTPEEAEAAAAAVAAQTGETVVASAVSNDSIAQTPGKVDVVGLGFITNMAEYMVAADVLISKAGPGTISEAAALSLPVMLTSFLPGQEEGNVDFVVDGGFGSFVEDTDPALVATEVGHWLNDDDKMKEMSEKAKAKGAPHAASHIVQMIGDSTLKWREHNEQVAAKEAEAAAAKEAEEEKAPTVAETTSPRTLGVAGIRPMEMASKLFRRQESVTSSTGTPEVVS